MDNWRKQQTSKLRIDCNGWSRINNSLFLFLSKDSMYNSAEKDIFNSKNTYVRNFSQQPD